MGREERARTCARGGERIPSLGSARALSLTTAACAVALVAGLGAVDATGLGAPATLAWGATALAAVLVAAGVLIRSSTPVHLAVAVLGALLLLRPDARLLVAPVYGAGLLLVAELGSRSIELRGVAGVGRGAQTARVAAIALVAALGACASAGIAAVVTSGAERSPGLTTVAALVLAAIFGMITWGARRRYSSNRSGSSPSAVWRGEKR